MDFVKIIQLIIFLTCNVSLVVCTKNVKSYKPNWASLDKRPLPKWYDDAKVGIFIHWGVFSVPSFGSEWFWMEWKGLVCLYIFFINIIIFLIIEIGRNVSEYTEYMSRKYPPDFSYQEFAKDFSAEFFNPDQWAELFKKSGAK